MSIQRWGNFSGGDINMDCYEHFRQIVIEDWQEYLQAETALTQAVLEEDEAAIQNARSHALRKGRSATLSLHHFSEVVLHKSPPHISATTADDVRRLLSEKCFMLRGEAKIEDVNLLNDVADALKHSVLRNKNRELSSDEAVLVVGSGFGVLRYFGEGKYGGIEQVLVVTKSGTRALSSILQNVMDAWRAVMRLPVPEMGQR